MGVPSSQAGGTAVSTLREPEQRRQPVNRPSQGQGKDPQGEEHRSEGTGLEPPAEHHITLCKLCNAFKVSVFLSIKKI